MRAWLIRFVSLYAFNVVVLLLIDLFVGAVRVGWAVLWASVFLTAATLWIKPLIHTVFRSMAERPKAPRSKLAEKLVQFGLVLLVAAIVWVLTVMFTGVRVYGWFWGYVIPPLLLLVAWVVYDAVDDRIEAKTGELYDRARGRGKTTDASATPPVATAPVPPPPVPSPERQAGQRELYDGLTDEQRRMFDELGKG